MSSEQFPVTLEEFCIDLSKQITHPELIAMFYYQQKSTGHLRDTVANFQTAFTTLQNS